MAESKGQPLDVKKVLEQSASKTTLQELAKKGIHRVKVLDEAAITRMIGEAVERILATKTNLISSEDRGKLVSASRKELDKLMKEFRQEKDKTELMAKDKASLAEEVENLQKQLQLQRKYTDELAKQRYEEGKASAKQQIEDLRGQLAEARTGAFEEAKTQQKDVIEEVRRQAADRETQIRREVHSEQEAEMGRKLLEVAQEESKKREELQNQLTEQNAKNMEMSQKLAASMEEMKKSEEQLFKTLTELFTKSLESLTKKLNDLRLRSFAGGPGGATGVAMDPDFRPSQATIDGLLATELESNLQNMNVEKKTAGRITSALDRLKALRKSGDANEKKDESGS